MPNEVLRLTDSIPERRLSAGDVLFAEGDLSSGLVVLVEGELLIEAAGMVMNRHAAPGTFVGEIGALLRQRRSATVTALAPTTVREVGEPDALFSTHPELGLEVARQLAARLHRLTSYIGDVQRHFADRDDHLGMFGELLHRIAARPAIDIEPGSDRSPDY